MTDKILAARELLRDLTPLRTDCGAYCEGACCRSEGEEEQGMLLFPGEEELYADCDFARVIPAQFAGIEDARVLVCDGHCRREERPLCCRLFPVAPRALKSGRIDVQTDRRAFFVCPLAGHGIAALDSAFVDACRDAFALLAQDERCLEYIKAWSRLMRQYRQGL